MGDLCSQAYSSLPRFVSRHKVSNYIIFSNGTITIHYGNYKLSLCLIQYFSLSLSVTSATNGALLSARTQLTITRFTKSSYKNFSTSLVVIVSSVVLILHIIEIIITNS